MPTNILMPALSPTMEKGKLAKWLKKEGDTVKSGDILAEIETDKATREVEAVDEGILGKILVADGTDDVPVNTPIAVILGEGEKAGDIAASPSPVAVKAAPPSPASGEGKASAMINPSPATREGGARSAPGGGSPNVTSMAGHGPTARASDAIEGAVALKQEAQHDLSPTEKLEALQWSKAGAAAAAQPSKAERRLEAKAKGYEGEMCGECGNFTLVRNGTCMKCDTCGSTTGCS